MGPCRLVIVVVTAAAAVVSEAGVRCDFLGVGSGSGRWGCSLSDGNRSGFPDAGNCSVLVVLEPSNGSATSEFLWVFLKAPS